MDSPSVTEATAFKRLEEMLCGSAPVFQRKATRNDGALTIQARGLKLLREHRHQSCTAA